MKLKRLLHRAHRWLGLLLGAQLLLWMASGVVMSWFHIDLVRSDTSAPLDLPPTLYPRQYASPGLVIAQQPDATEVRLRTIAGALYYEAVTPQGNAYFHPSTGDRVGRKSRDQIRAIASAAYVGDVTVKDTKLLTTPPPEYRGPTPVWQVTFEDKAGLRLYLAPDTGEVLKRRSRLWRVYDFFWMLHIMDYDDRSDFNNPLLRAASATGLLFALTGAGLVLVRVLNGRYAADITGDK